MFVIFVKMYVQINSYFHFGHDFNGLLLFCKGMKKETEKRRKKEV